MTGSSFLSFCLSVLVTSTFFSCKPVIKNTDNNAPQEVVIHDTFPKAKGYITDLENILTDEQEKELSAMIDSFEKATTNEIALLTIDTIAPYTDMGEYASALGSRWGVGKKDKDNGVTIVISSDMREMFIASGIGTAAILNDTVLQQVIDNEMIPQFREGRPYEGIKLGLQSLMNKWD